RSLWLPTDARDEADPVGGIGFISRALCLVTRGWASVLGSQRSPGNESNMPHMIFDMVHMIFDMAHMIFDMAHIIFDMAHMIFDMAHMIFDMAQSKYHLSQSNYPTKSNRQQAIVLRHLS
ncbi:MAG: hypothetical protein GDA48_28675, partial [Hormoscilla sp. GM102CHS1]|nr:hypothetical protein [Hormoscilla sp. GM102CHS1]